MCSVCALEELNPLFCHCTKERITLKTRTKRHCGSLFYTTHRPRLGRTVSSISGLLIGCRPYNRTGQCRRRYSLLNGDRLPTVLFYGIGTLIQHPVA